MSSNSAFIGLPVIAAVNGDQRIFYAAIYMTVARIFSWTLGLNLFIEGGKGHVFRRIITNPNNLAVVIAVIVVTTVYSGVEYFVQNWKCLWE